jgi:hypothetical protein
MNRLTFDRTGSQTFDEILCLPARRPACVGSPAMMAAAMSTLYSLTLLVVLAMLFRPTVMGLLSAPLKDHAKQEVVPDVGELPDQRDHQNRRGQGHDDAVERCARSRRRPCVPR